MTDTIALGGHQRFASAQDDKAPATAGRHGSATATSAVVEVLTHRWPTYLALA